MFQAYPKIHNLGKEDVEGILSSEIYIQEKIDGANLSVWFEKGICIGSRTQVICQDGEIIKPFNGACEYILTHEGINRLLQSNTSYRLYGERLVKHTIVYPEKYYKKFYMFDIMDGEEWLSVDTVYNIASLCNIEKPHLFTKGIYNIEQLKEFAVHNIKDVVGEGIVIKPVQDFYNKRGNRVYAKMVHEKFKEKNNIIFGNHHKGDNEMKFTVEYITENRVLKIINKIEQNEGRRIDISDTPRVMGMVYHDAFEEEIRGYAGKKTIDFARLQVLCSQRSRVLFHDIINNFNS